MDLCFPRRIWVFLRSDPWFSLAFVWVCALVCGMVSSRAVVAFFSRSLAELLRAPQALLPFLTMQLLFLAASAAVLRSRCNLLLLPLVFAKGFLHSFLGCSILRVCGSSGWLIRLLLHFSECASVPVIWLFWIYGLRTGREGMGAALGCTACSLLLVLSFDYSVISPFLTNILFF